ncbi:hypothetical protein [Nitrospira lenta]|uniref:Uncharacterized protein n=1 Tax=Nitrospira lenta TaxID=1436998 RepID=A0A330L5S4_9BACT|nr:hypothetical protein [Nitrospira lenta]SPP64690.1 conserved exported hypothetical protein [Nitrospira lenta]
MTSAMRGANIVLNLCTTREDRPFLRRSSALIVLLVLLCSPVSALAQSGSLDQSPTAIVKRYVGLDKKGARMDAMSFETLVPYIDWTEEPLWGRVVVIQDVTVPEDYRKWEVVNKLEVVIPTTFTVLGSVYLETAAFVPDAITEEVRFRVKAVRSKWRIVEPVIPPHIGLKRMIDLVREAEVKETDTEKRGILAALGETLRKVKP